MTQTDIIKIGIACMGSLTISTIFYGKELSIIFWNAVYKLKDWWNRPSELDKDRAETESYRELTRTVTADNERLIKAEEERLKSQLNKSKK